MHIKKNGYVAGAVLMLTFSKKLRDHVEYEKVLCRILADTEKTRKFKENTAELKDQLYAFRYNNPATERLTAVGRTKNANR
jgi:hypothetical protein